MGAALPAVATEACGAGGGGRGRGVRPTAGLGAERDDWLGLLLRRGAAFGVVGRLFHGRAEELASRGGASGSVEELEFGLCHEDRHAVGSRSLDLAAGELGRGHGLAEALLPRLGGGGIVSGREGVVYELEGLVTVRADAAGGAFPVAGWRSHYAVASAVAGGVLPQDHRG